MTDAATKPRYWCMTKAMAASGDQLKYGLNWAGSRRAVLKLFDDHLECGDWRIDYTAILNATLYSIFGGYVLRIETSETTFHFGVNWNLFWRRELPFPVQRTKGNMKYSAFSIAVRVALVGFLVYVIWDEWIR